MSVNIIYHTIHDLPVPYVNSLPDANLSGNETRPGSKYIGNWKMRGSRDCCWMLTVSVGTRRVGNALEIR